MWERHSLLNKNSPVVRQISETERSGGVFLKVSYQSPNQPAMAMGSALRFSDGVMSEWDLLCQHFLLNMKSPVVEQSSEYDRWYSSSSVQLNLFLEPSRRSAMGLALRYSSCVVAECDMVVRRQMTITRLKQAMQSITVVHL